MAETTDQLRADIALTRNELAATMDEISARVSGATRRIPFYGMERRQIVLITGGAAAVLAMAFLAFYGWRRH